MLDELCINTKMFIGLLYPYNFTRDNVKMMCNIPGYILLN